METEKDLRRYIKAGRNPPTRLNRERFVCVPLSWFNSGPSYEAVCVFAVIGQLQHNYGVDMGDMVRNVPLSEIADICGLDKILVERCIRQLEIMEVLDVLWGENPEIGQTNTYRAKFEI